MENDSTVDHEIFVVTHNSIAYSLTIEFKGEIKDLISHNRDKYYKKHLYLPFNSEEFKNSMAKQGISYIDGDPYSRGYKFFKGTLDEIDIRFYSIDIVKSSLVCEIAALETEDRPMVNEVFKQRAIDICTAMYNAFLSYFKGSDVEPAPVQQQQGVPWKTVANMEAAAASVAAMSARAAPPENYYNNNVVDPPVFNNTKLRSLVPEDGGDVQHSFTITVRNPELDNAIEMGDHVLDRRALIEFTDIAIMPLIHKGAMCKGINPSFVPDSIVGADIVLVVNDMTGKWNPARVGGIATLKIKEDTIEIDLICTSSLYKMAGKLLLHKIMRIAMRLGKEKIELLSVDNPHTLQFYQRFGFKKVPPYNAYAQEGKYKKLLAYRRRISRKNGKAAPAKAAAAKGAPAWLQPLAADVAPPAPAQAKGAPAWLQPLAANVAPLKAKNKTLKKKNKSNNNLWAMQNALWAKKAW